MYLRSITFNIVFYISIPVFGFLFLPFIVSKKITRYLVSIWAKIIIFCLKKIIGIKIIYENNHIKKNKGYLIAANHQSIFDTIFFLSSFDKVVYIVKKELKYIPIYGWYTSRLGHIFIDRKNGIKSINLLRKKVALLIKKKYKVVIFPEGSRQKDGKVGLIKPGIFAIHKESKSPVYPIYINSGKTWPKDGFLVYNKNIYISTNEPIKNIFEKAKFLRKLKIVLERASKKHEIKYKQ